MRYNKKDLTGKRFGRLTVLQESAERKNNKIMWLCQCKCGKQLLVRAGSLVEGNTKSCGCLRNEKVAEAARKYLRTHGYGVDNRLYHTWAAMKNRCYNPNNDSYHYYGHKGIRVCAEWKEDFPTFRQWAVSNGYADNLDIHRLDNTKGYGPTNCTWLSHSEHATLHQELRRNNIA